MSAHARLFHPFVHLTVRPMALDKLAPGSAPSTEFGAAVSEQPSNTEDSQDAIGQDAIDVRDGEPAEDTAVTADPRDARPRSHGQEAVPRLPRGAGFKLTRPEVFRILLFAALLFGVLALRKPCSDGVATFVESFDEVDAGVAEPTPAPKASRPIGGYIRMTGDMSEEEIRAKLDQARASHRDAGQADAGPTPE